MPNIPAALSAVAMKLLAKTAEDRYQRFGPGRFNEGEENRAGAR